MRLYKFMMILSLFVVAGCSGDEANEAKNQSTNTQPVEQAAGQVAPEAKGALGNYAGQVELAREAKKMQEEADRKRKEMEQGI